MGLIKFGNHTDHNFNQLKNVILDTVTSMPQASDLYTGRILYYTGDGKFYYCDGDNWHSIDENARNLDGHKPSYYLDRANHTGTQTSDSISDLDAVIKGHHLSDFDQPTTQINMGGHRVTNLGDPTSDGDAVSYRLFKILAQTVATSAIGITVKEPVKTAITENVELSGEQTIGNTQLNAGDRVLVTAQADPKNNGIYTVNAGDWERAADANDTHELTSGTIVVDTTHNTLWILTSSDQGNTVTPGVTAQAWVKFGAGTTLRAGSGIDISNGVISVTEVGIRKIVFDIPPGNPSVTVQHNLGEQYPSYTVYDVKNSQSVLVSYTPVSKSTGTLDFGTAPESGQYKAIFIG